MSLVQDIQTTALITGRRFFADEVQHPEMMGSLDEASERGTLNPEIWNLWPMRIPLTMTTEQPDGRVAMEITTVANTPGHLARVPGQFLRPGDVLECVYLERKGTAVLAELHADSCLEDTFHQCEEVYRLDRPPNRQGRMLYRLHEGRTRHWRRKGLGHLWSRRFDLPGLPGYELSCVTGLKLNALQRLLSRFDADLAIALDEHGERVLARIASQEKERVAARPQRSRTMK